MTVLVVQCRLGSTRLPQKAILPLKGKTTILDWVLCSMALVKADRYFLATDYESEETLAPFAKAHNFEIFAGSNDDVLHRFCALIKHVQADTVIRATADNPFLFYEAANELALQYKRKQCDYITWTGLPHGSGVEVFNAHSLLQSYELSNTLFEHEHVCPALYNHQEKFICTFLPAPEEWNFPTLRTTVDTEGDYAKAQKLARMLISPASAIDILIAAQKLERRILLVPSTKKGHGTGHLQRCIALSYKIDCEIYIPLHADLVGVDQIIAGINPQKIINRLPFPNEYALIVTDSFALTKSEAANFASCAPVIAIDEGSNFTDYAEYLLDIIPSLEFDRKVNYQSCNFIDLPKNVQQKPKRIKKILISVGGEDPANFSLEVAKMCTELKYDVTVILPQIKYDQIDQKSYEDILFSLPINDLKEHLYQYDLVITHYGLTAFEAVAAHCAVLLLPTSQLHCDLAEKYGFRLLLREEMNTFALKMILGDSATLFPTHPDMLAIAKRVEGSQTLDDFLNKLSLNKRLACPVCRNSFEKLAHTKQSLGERNLQSIFNDQQSQPDKVLERYKNKTYRTCNNCGLIYLSWSLISEKQYEQSYFFEEYQEQYGKTYLDDFSTIKKAGIKRITTIDALYWQMQKQKRKKILNLLDIGCAYGPFLSAASDNGWHPHGIDISSDAIEYVTSKLGMSATCSDFLDFNSMQTFQIQSFNAITMWYVIEHFKNLDEVLKKVAQLLEVGGIFAFSTPSGSGISARNDENLFYKKSPSDHYAIFQPEKVNRILSKYGFKVSKIISTGHHPERFPLLKDKPYTQKSLIYNFLMWYSKLFSLGDTFEVYCEKIKEVKL
ncbi:MAG: cytidylyltransferase domain-containing protein [Treponemataceae bacterium]